MTSTGVTSYICLCILYTLDVDKVSLWQATVFVLKSSNVKAVALHSVSKPQTQSRIHKEEF